MQLYFKKYCLSCPRPHSRGIKRWCASDVRLSVAYIGPKSRIEAYMNTKIGTEVATSRDLDTTCKVKRSTCRGGAYCGGLPHSLLLLQYVWDFSIAKHLVSIVTTLYMLKHDHRALCPYACIVTFAVHKCSQISRTYYNRTRVNI